MDILLEMELVQSIVVILVLDTYHILVHLLEDGIQEEGKRMVVEYII